MFSKYFYVINVISKLQTFLHFSIAALWAYVIFYREDYMKKAIIITMFLLGFLMFLPDTNTIKAMLVDGLVGDDFENARNIIDYIIEKIGEVK